MFKSADILYVKMVHMDCMRRRTHIYVEHVNYIVTDLMIVTETLPHWSPICYANAYANHF